jgi:hypothetical protein
VKDFFQRAPTLVKSKWLTMNGDIQLLVIKELVEFEKQPVEVQDFTNITDHFKGN